MHKPCTSKLVEPFDENAGSWKLERQLKRLTSASAATDIEGLVEKEDVVVQTDIAIPAGASTDCGAEEQDDDDLAPLPLDGEEDLPPMTDKELFWYQAECAIEKRIKETQEETRRVCERLEEAETSIGELEVTRDRELELLQAKIEKAKELHRAAKLDNEEAEDEPKKRKKE
uniref:Shootin-1 n=1 Tax=Steinernema glaseri TaxID=37863 RepID=A0A1I7YDH7_9BILA